MTIVQELPFNAEFVSDMITTHGPIQAVTLSHRAFGDQMNPNIKDMTLRLILWQINHSLYSLSTRTGKTFNSVADVEMIIDTTEDRDTLTTARHIIGAVDKLIEHVTIDFSNK